MTPMQRVLRSDNIIHGRAAVWTPIGGNGERPGISTAEVKDWIARGFADVLETKASCGDKVKRLVALTDAGKAAAIAGYRFMPAPELPPDVKATGFVVKVGDVEEPIANIEDGMALVRTKPRGAELRRLPDNCLMAVY